MAIDPARLTQSELLQIVNATPLGAVLTRSRLRRQMDAGALRFGDGTHIHLVRYVRWLVGELDKPRPAKMDYAEAKRRQAARNRAATKAAQDIYPVPEIADYDRRQAAGESFRLFCQTYFARAFWRAWSDDHLRVIAKIEKAVLEGGLFALAMPRASGKTALARCAALWAILYGYRPFVCMIAGSQDNARELLKPIRTFVLEEPLLLEDFPEAVHPFRCLENSSKRQGQQHIRGQLTHVHWGLDGIVFDECGARPSGSRAPAGPSGHQGIVATTGIPDGAEVLHLSGVWLGQFGAIDGNQIVRIDLPGLLSEDFRRPRVVVPMGIAEVMAQSFDGVFQLAAGLTEEPGGIGQLDCAGEDNPARDFPDGPKGADWEIHAERLKIFAQQRRYFPIGTLDDHSSASAQQAFHLLHRRLCAPS